MNKQELIDKLKKRLGTPSEIDGSQFDQGFEWATKCDLALITKLDEPEKPVVPQFVADWYEENKDDLEYNLYKLCTDFREQKLRADLNGWFSNDDNKCIETLVKMKLFGYEVEKEKQYVVAIPDDERNKFIQLWKNRKGKLLFNFEDKIRYGKVHLLTEQEIKQKDERLWQFAKEVEE